jgi:hypothetical protein
MTNKTKKTTTATAKPRAVGKPRKTAAQKSKQAMNSVKKAKPKQPRTKETNASRKRLELVYRTKMQNVIVRCRARMLEIQQVLASIAKEKVPSKLMEKRSCKRSEYHRRSINSLDVFRASEKSKEQPLSKKEQSEKWAKIKKDPKALQKYQSKAQALELLRKAEEQKDLEDHKDEADKLYPEADLKKHHMECVQRLLSTVKDM